MGGGGRPHSAAGGVVYLQSSSLHLKGWFMSDLSPPAPRRRGLGAALESKQPSRRPFLDYRRFVQNHYDGLPGALTAFTGVVTGHEALAGRLFRPGAFDVRGCKRILDAGCGPGRYSAILLRHAGAEALISHLL